MRQSLGNIGSLLVVLAVFLVYLAPALLAKRKRNSTEIFALNLFLGWTFIGWVVALVWALIKNEPQQGQSGNTKG
jgi:ABC-type sugar transport system permease subunit